MTQAQQKNPGSQPPKEKNAMSTALYIPFNKTRTGLYTRPPARQSKVLSKTQETWTSLTCQDPPYDPTAGALQVDQVA
jgi:hypothetical protein